MGQDQKIRRKHKQRTVEHKKHAVFPGMRTPKDVIIQAGSIKAIQKIDKKEHFSGYTKVKRDNPLWSELDKHIKTIQALGGSSALASRRAAEFGYRYVYRKLAQAGEVPEVRKKYRG